jgi:formylglycine-generating enzyme required for sulfatase activity
LLLSAALLLPGCAGAQGLALPETVAIPAGPFIEGSDAAEREAAYRLDEAAYGHSVTRKQGWYDREPPRREATMAAYAITVTPITNRQYLAFVEATGHPAPDVEPQVWRGYGLIHPYERTRRHAWVGGKPPEGRLDHPVVLVSQGDARDYADWLSAESGQRWRLPTGREWEKAARGPGGGLFPWGDAWDAGKLNSHDAGPFDTLPVGSFPAGASPYGLLDAAGQVYEWTSDRAGEGRYLVRGGSWDDSGCGVCRPAARHGRPEGIKHILIGFRLVREEG